MQIERIGTHRGTVITEKSDELYTFLSHQPISEHWQPFGWDRQTFEARTDGKHLFVRAEWKLHIPEMVFAFDKDHELTIYVPTKEHIKDIIAGCIFVLPLMAALGLDTFSITQLSAFSAGQHICEAIALTIVVGWSVANRNLLG